MLTKIPMGAKVKQAAVDRFKGRVSEKVVGAILSEQVDAAKIHYQQGIGYFYCFEGECCETCGLPTIRYILPFLRYAVQSGDLRQLAYGLPVVINYLSLGKDSYEDLVTKSEIYGSVMARDLLITCTDEQYQKLKFDALGEARWKTDGAILEAAKVLYQQYTRLIDLSVAREINVAKFRELMAANATPTMSPQPGHIPGGQFAAIPGMAQYPGVQQQALLSGAAPSVLNLGAPAMAIPAQNSPLTPSVTPVATPVAPLLAEPAVANPAPSMVHPVEASPTLQAVPAPLLQEPKVVNLSEAVSQSMPAQAVPLVTLPASVPTLDVGANDPGFDFSDLLAGPSADN